MAQTRELFLILAGFGLVALAAKQIGEYFSLWKLPKITGYLISGLLAGAFVLGFISEDAVHRLHFIDEAALAFIAFAAGSELHLTEVRGRLRTIGWVTLGLVVFTFTLMTAAVYALGSYIPFVQDMPATGRLAVSLLAGAIMVARSPSSAIAIVNELRARGPFTQVAIGVTVIMDVVVIVVFAINASIADALLTEVSMDLSFVLLIIGELLLALLLATVLFLMLRFILAQNFSRYLKANLIVALGYGTFVVAHLIRDTGHDMGIEILIEPLLICVIASFLINNYDKNRLEFSSIIEELSPAVFIAFFTLTGASLELDVLAQTWPIALALFTVRLLAIVLGSLSGGIIAGADMKHNRLRWMGFITQAGVALGLAKEVASEFPTLGNAFATMIISVVVLNEIVGPVLFKIAINRVGEAHTRAASAAFDGVRDVIIFGMKASAVSLAQQLLRHEWQVKLVCVGQDIAPELLTPEIDIHTISDISIENLRRLDLDRADALVALLTDEDDNYEICQLAYENFGTDTMVVQLHDRANVTRFHDLGVLIVEPQTAANALLEHYVRSPVGTALLLGTEEGQDVVDVEVRNPSLHHVAVRDLGLPLDVMILSIQRDRHAIVTRGYTQLRLGDKVTMVGPEARLAEVIVRFDA